MATIYEVAARAGVSPATVSRVLNGQRVSADKARRRPRRRTRAALHPQSHRATAASTRPRSSSRCSSPTSRTRSSRHSRGASRTGRRRRASRSCCATPTTTRRRRRATWTSRTRRTWRASSSRRPPWTATSRTPSSHGRPLVAVDRHTGFDIDSVMVDNRRGGPRGHERPVRRRLPADRLHRGPGSARDQGGAPARLAGGAHSAGPR